MLVGPDELARGTVKVRQTATREEVEVPRARLGAHMTMCLADVVDADAVAAPQPAAHGAKQASV